MGGYCLCRSGGCVGAEGNCHKEVAQYELVASGIRLRNVGFNAYLYAPEAFFTRQLKISSDPGPDRWNVYRVPGVAFGQVYYVFSPVDYPEGYVASYDAGILGARVIVWDIKGSPLHDPWDLFNSLCEPPAHPGAWEISMLHAKGQGLKWYVGFGSWGVFGYILGALAGGSVGKGGQWMPEPPVNLSLPRCG